MRRRRCEPVGDVHYGYAASAYFGGRAETRVRKTDVPVVVLDVTSMYPTVYILQDLQALLGAEALMARDATDDTRALVASTTLEQLYNPNFWRNLNRLVLVEPNGEVLPVRMRLDPTQPFCIAVTHFISDTPCWYTLADVICAKLHTGRAPEIVRAIEFIGRGQKQLRSTAFRNQVPLDPARSIFKTIVEQRQIAKNAKQWDASDIARLQLGLKQFANSGAYGIHAEVNVTPSADGKTQSGHVYSNIDYACANVHDERPGRYANFILASLVTGAARLLLGMLEAEVIRLGGTFAFCDTDSLAIVAGDNCPPQVPHLILQQVRSIAEKFNALNPYDQNIVKALLKVEYAEVKALRCFAISAKRYVLYEYSTSGRVRIVKASESGLGGIIGRTQNEKTGKLARRIWLYILSKEIPMHPNQRRRAEQLSAFDVPLRRKLPLSQPDILRRSGFKRFNNKRLYEEQIKPFGFLQAVTPAIRTGKDDIQPVAPFEQSVVKSIGLPWIDVKTGKPIQIDWHGTALAGTVPVVTLSEFVEGYARHPEAKAADEAGNPADEETRGVLGRLQLRATSIERIGKEIDRLEEDDATTLWDGMPKVFRHSEAANLSAVIEVLGKLPQAQAASALGISERRWRDIVKGRAKPRRKLLLRMKQLSLDVLANRNSLE